MATTAVTPDPNDVRRTFSLPSGKQVVIRRGKGRDLRMGLLAAGPKADPYRIMFSLIAQLALIDGKRMPLEMIDELDFDDAQELLTEGGAALGPLGKIKGLRVEGADPAAEEEAEKSVVQ